jgi:thioesterase domain-containing protein
MGRDEPRLVRFRLACAPPLRMVPLDYGDWPEWTAPDFDFSKLIARLVQAIEAEAPAGPLYLAGYSLGGEIAHAVASALSASGRSVAFLGILDTNIAAAEGADAPAQPFSRRREIRALVQAMRRGDAADELALMAARRLLSPRWKPLLRLVARSHRFTLPYDFGFYLNRRLRMPILVDLVRAGVRQTPTAQPLHIPAVLFRSLERGPDAPEDLGWRKLCPDITVMPIAGGHNTMFDPPNLEPLSRRFVSAFQTITERAGAA